MAKVRKIDLNWIKGLMLFSQVLLVLFTAQWLYGQYNEEQSRLKKDLTKLFNDVQYRISDSLLKANVIDPIPASAAESVSMAPARNHRSQLSPQGLHRLLSGATALSNIEARKLFGTDTIVFNEMFTTQMRNNGWNFNARWVDNLDTNKKGVAGIFIPSGFFTDASGDVVDADNGVMVNNCFWFICWKMTPQLLFALILLTLTATAFRITFRSLKSQIRLSNMKDDFISNMSHELKTPIATVKVALEALNNFNIIDDPKKSREYVGMAAAEMDRLELLATRVLNTSLLDTGNIYLQQESYDLKQLVEEVLQSVQLRLRQFGAQANVEVTGSNFRIPMDKLHMQGVLVNLIDNSLKYGNKPVNIDIRLSEQNGAVRLELNDNGPGIPEEYKEKVFEKFFRVPTGNLHNIKGHGLGLSYAAQVMRQHNGNIFVNNSATGGCVFTLTF